MPTPLTRIRVLGISLGLLLMVLVGRLWWLQLTHWSGYSQQALKNRTMVVYKSAPRGLIYDRRGEHILAENRHVWSVHLVPAELPADDACLEKEVQFLAGVLSTEDAPASTTEVRQALDEARRAKSVEPIPLTGFGQDLTFDQVAEIEEHQLELPGVVVMTTTRRHYPYGDLAAQAIGYARRISKEQYEDDKGYEHPPDPQDPTSAELGDAEPDRIYPPDSIIGAEGAEAFCELETSGDVPVPILPGRRGRLIYEIDADMTPQRLIAKRDPQIGASVYLTLDAKVQYVAERALRAALEGHPERMGAAVVMDTRNGDLIALASEPCLDLNDWVSGLTSAQWNKAQEDRGFPLLNKAIGATYPPGSIFKIISVCAALETTKVTTKTTAVCKGRIFVGREHRKYECWIADRGGHGVVDLVEAIAKSCNIWFYRSVLEFGLDPNDIAKYAHRFGLGETTALGLKGELRGSLPEPKYGDRLWTQGNSLNYVIGQELTVTPLQMCRACAAIANGGKLLKPRIVRRIRWPAHVRQRPVVDKSGDARTVKLKDPDTLGIVRLGMRSAVTMAHGTAGALADLADMRDSLEEPSSPAAGARHDRRLLVAGKTGTAQHDPRKPNHSWCLAFAPYDAKPGEAQFAVCTLVAQGGTGSATAVPITKQILRALFGLYEPDDPDFTLPKPMGPPEVLKAQRRRIAEAKAWAAEREREAEEAESTENDS